MHERQNHVLALKRRVCRADLRRGCSVESAGAVGQRDGRPCRPRPCRVEKPTLRRHCTRSYRRLSQGASDVSCAAQAIVRRDRGRGIRVTVPGQRFSSYHQNHRVSTEPRRVRRVAQCTHCAAHAPPSHTAPCSCAHVTRALLVRYALRYVRAPVVPSLPFSSRTGASILWRHCKFTGGIPAHSNDPPCPLQASWVCTTVRAP